MYASYNFLMQSLMSSEVKLKIAEFAPMGIKVFGGIFVFTVFLGIVVRLIDEKGMK